MFYKNYKKLIDKIVWFIPSKKHRDNLRLILWDVISSVYKLEFILNYLNSYEDERCIIIGISGGLNDQFHKYVLGETIKNKFNMKVKYDITWYNDYGIDDDGNFNRHFELLKLCPNIDIDIASEEEVFVYRNCFMNAIKNINGNITDEIKNKRNIYIYYYSYPTVDGANVDEITDSIDLDKLHYNTLNSYNLELYNELKSEKASVAVHVRLGDSHVMNNFKNIFYSSYDKYVDYIIDSIYKMQDKLSPLKPKFFFFSDDINWVNDNVISKLDKNISYRINKEKNPPHLDIYLMSSAKHQIISLGGFGRLASLFNKNKDKIIIKPSDFQSLKNS